MKHIVLALAISASFLPVSSLPAKELLVPEHYPAIQAALDSASDRDLVRVSAGRYVIPRPLDINRLRSSGAPAKNLTLLASGDVVVELATGAAGSVLVLASGEDDRTLIHGFTLTGGTGTSRDGRRVGGGILCVDSSPRLRSLTIVRNRAGRGGGLAVEGTSRPQLERCRILENVAEVGGGIWGGGLDMKDCFLGANHAELGGGASLGGRLPSRLEGCEISGNSGTGVLVSSGEAALERCRVVGNYSATRAGGLEVWPRTSATLTNSLIIANRGLETGGLHSDAEQLEIASCTFARNTSRSLARQATGGIRLGPGASATLSNSIVYDNAPSSIADFTGLEARSSCIEHATIAPGSGNINRSPRFEYRGRYDQERFVNLAVAGDLYLIPQFVENEGDFRLQEGSPAIGAGSAELAPAVDIDGKSRRCGPVDMGVYQQGHCVKRVRFNPTCVRLGLELAKLEVVPSVAAVGLEIGNLPRLEQNGRRTTSLRLVDDGTGGDEVAGDGVFTAGGLSPVAPDDGSRYGWAWPGDVELVIHSAGGEEIRATERFHDGLAFIRGLPVPEVLAIDGRAHYSPHVVSLKRELEGSFPHESATPEDIAMDYYERFPDDRDVLMIVPLAKSNASCECTASSRQVSNDAGGIGLGAPGEWDQTDLYGSRGRLRSVINLFPGFSARTLNHEILHRWAVKLDPALDLGLSHWGVIQRPSTGFGMDNPSGHGVYSRIRALGGERYECVVESSAADHYSDLELYLMGLAPLSEVDDPIVTLVRPRLLSREPVDPARHTARHIYRADGARSVSVSEIIARHGARVPPFEQSQRRFRSSLIIVHDRLLTPVEMAIYEHLMAEYERAESEAFSPNFATASEQRASVSTAIPEPLGEAVFRRGDANGDDVIDVSDVVRILLLLSSPQPLACADAADANDDGAVNIADALFTFQRIFPGGGAWPPPHPGCGTDPTPDALDCGEPTAGCQ